MKNNYKEPHLTYALNKSDVMVRIDSVERGYSCNCRCPKCKEPLNARLGKGGKQPHFAHKPNSDCRGSYMTALHLLAEQIIEREKAVMVPVYKEIKEQRLSFKYVEVEQRIERKDLQPDLVGETEDGKRWFIEIRNTHEIDDIKKNKLIESGITCLEIDVSEQTLDNLKTFLLCSAERREWINNPNYEAQLVEAKREIKRKKVSYVVNYLKDKPNLLLPAYSDYRKRTISINDVSLSSFDVDGLHAKVKVISSDGTPYLFYIGDKDASVISGHEKDCNELLVYIGNIALDTDISSEKLDFEWLFHHDYAKIEEEFEKQSDNKKYKIRPESYCLQCDSRPEEGLCDYMRNVFHRQGVKYIECNEEMRLRDEKAVLLQTKDNNLIDKYYEHLMATGTYKTETDLSAKIIECKKTLSNSRITILYKETESMPLYPFHIGIISVEGFGLRSRKVADFTNKTSAMDSYNRRLML